MHQQELSPTSNLSRPVARKQVADSVRPHICYYLTILTVLTFLTILTVMTILTSHLDPPANGQAVVYLTGLLEVFISESLILATLSDNSVRYQAINVYSDCSDYSEQNDHTGSTHSVLQTIPPSNVQFLLPSSFLNKFPMAEVPGSPTYSTV